ncbi:GntR family transcriptional regulator [Shinella pollutisoli]|uniref:GntR family transcriptional regulator n=1 Tax=Shinella pollutisoli TaxID=2250594 RepID=A0ABV7DGT6_9HYPH|nr:GntR family transcriptional regulator [Shinella pollutisoli]
MTARDGGRPLSERVAGEIRDGLIAGRFAPGERLSEHEVAARYGISRNTLREVFRLLTSQGLLAHIPNRGVFVASPDAAAVLDIYRARRVIQRGAVEAAVPGHPAFSRMAALVADGEEGQARGDWQRVGTANMAFHRAMVELCDSPRLSACFDLILAELRLVFGRLEDTAHLHAPYVALNAALLVRLQAGDRAAALAGLDAYLTRSERSVLAALQRGKAAERS